MEAEDDRDQTVRRIVLPSGRRIEVLRVFDERERVTDDSAPGLARSDDPADPLAEPGGPPTAAARGAEPANAATAGTSAPHLCPECSSSLVYPIAWTAAGAERWRVELRCPNCEHTDGALLDLDTAEHFDEELERGSETLMSDLARLAEANMLEDLERFAAALRADAILPLDF